MKLLIDVKEEEEEWDKKREAIFLTSRRRRGRKGGATKIESDNNRLKSSPDYSEIESEGRKRYPGDITTCLIHPLLYGL